MELGYFSSHFSLTLSKFSNACDSVDDRYILFKSEVNSFLSLYDTYFKVFLTWWITQRWYSVCKKAVILTVGELAFLKF